MVGVPHSDLPRAEALVRAYGSSKGMPERRLGPDYQVHFGETDFCFIPAENRLLVRVYVNPAKTQGQPEEIRVNYFRMLAALNNPEIGGMYDRAGGYFSIDEQVDAFFLVRSFDVSSTDPGILLPAVHRLQDIAAKWMTTWLAEVALIIHGHRKPPLQPVR